MEQQYMFSYSSFMYSESFFQGGLDNDSVEEERIYPARITDANIDTVKERINSKTTMGIKCEEGSQQTAFNDQPSTTKGWQCISCSMANTLFITNKKKTPKLASLILNMLFKKAVG